MATKTKRGMGWAAWTAGNIARTSVSQEEVLTNNKMIIWRIIEDIGAIRTKSF